jgi:hypothetical protein
MYGMRDLPAMDGTRVWIEGLRMNGQLSGEAFAKEEEEEELAQGRDPIILPLNSHLNRLRTSGGDCHSKLGLIGRRLGSAEPVGSAELWRVRLAANFFLGPVIPKLSTKMTTLQGF